MRSYKRHTRRKSLLKLTVEVALLFVLGFVLLQAVSYITTRGEIPVISSFNLFRKEADTSLGWNLILVNDEYCVPSDYEVELTELSNGEKVDSRIYPQLQQMFDDARAAGLELFVREGYRTSQDQKDIMDERIQQYLDEGYSRSEANAYRSAGWNLVKSENPHGEIFPSFVDVAMEVERYINKSEYSEENKSNYKGSLLTRLESLTNGINSLIFTADDLEDSELFDENVIVDLSRVGSTETKALIMGILILKLQEHRIACSDEPNSDLHHVTVLEEAHNLLKRTSTEQSSETANLLGKSVEMLANSIAEMRTYGEGFIIADQSPGLLDMSVIRNTNTKIIMRLPDFSDRELVGKAAGLNDDQIVEIAKLPRGVAAVYQNDWISPVLCSVEKPKLKEGNFVETASYPDESSETFLFDLLDSKFRAKLDDLTAEDAFRKAILKSSVSTEVKVKLMDYLAVKKSAESIKILASMIFDYFKNTKDVLENSAEETSVEALKTAIMAELEPSIMQFEDEQINLLITLIIKEYTDRCYVDYPIWHEFAIRIARGDII